MTPQDCELNATAHEKRGEWGTASDWWYKAEREATDPEQKRRYRSLGAEAEAKWQMEQERRDSA